MRLRLVARPQQRPGLKIPHAFAAFALFCILYPVYRAVRGGSHDGNPVGEPILGPGDVQQALAPFARTREEIQLIQSVDPRALAALAAPYSGAQDERHRAKLSLVAKAVPGRNRQELISQIEADPTQQLLLAILARRMNGEAGKNAAFEDEDEAGEVNKQSSSHTSRQGYDDDVITRILAAMPEDKQSATLKQMSMDSENKWRDMPSWALEALERDGLNPLNRNCSKLVVPDHEGKYGGFTADCGWIIMAAVYAMETGACIEFPNQWGHGCEEEDREPGWTCFFKPIQQHEQTNRIIKRSFPEGVEKLRSGIQAHRRMTRRDELFKEGFTGHRYSRLNGLIAAANENEKRTPFELDWNADLLAWRSAFRWTFRVNDKVRARLDALEANVLRGFRPEDIAGAHLRFGDKLGLKPGPREAYMVYQLRDFAERLVLYYRSQNKPFPRAVFVATDDYNASVELGRILGKSVTILTSADPDRDTGFSIVEYREKWSAKAKFDAAVRLWADMEILSRTEVALLSFQSNIGRTVTLMRWGKPASSVISVDPTGPRCSRSARKNQLGSHNFWLCP